MSKRNSAPPSHKLQKSRASGVFHIRLFFFCSPQIDDLAMAVFARFRGGREGGRDEERELRVYWRVVKEKGPD